MFSPGGFDATLDKWSTLGVYARIRVLDHLSRRDPGFRESYARQDVNQC